MARYGIEEAISVLGERGAVSPVAQEELHVECLLSVFDDAPGLAVGHAHALGGRVEGAHLAHAQAELGDARSEGGLVLGRGGSPR